MNKLIKLFIATLGAINIAFNIFIPIAISLLIINLGILNEVWSSVVLIAGTLSSLYRGIDTGFLRN